jgi:hypothetical protein
MSILHKMSKSIHSIHSSGRLDFNPYQSIDNTSYNPGTTWYLGGVRSPHNFYKHYQNPYDYSGSNTSQPE